MSLGTFNTSIEPIKSPTRGYSSSSSESVLLAPKNPTTAVITLNKVSYSGDCEQYRYLIEQYDWDVERMMSICALESGGNIYAHNTTDNHQVCMGSYGLFQIACSHFKSDEDRYAINLNVAMAHELYKNRGNYKDWTTCKKTTQGCY